MNKSRREFIKNSSVAAAGISIVPASVVSGLGHRAPSDKLNIAGVGIGGKGHPNLAAMNAEKMQFANISLTDELRIVTSDDFQVIDGHPYFNTQYARFNAMETAGEYIKHTYRHGWDLPDMPV